MGPLFVHWCACGWVRGSSRGGGVILRNERSCMWWMPCVDCRDTSLRLTVTCGDVVACSLPFTTASLLGGALKARSVRYFVVTRFPDCAARLQPGCVCWSLYSNLGPCARICSLAFSCIFTARH